MKSLSAVEAKAGKKFGDAKNPLLVSCRSGAKFSMPGMMDTVLNIGLNDDTAQGMVKLTNNERFVFDAYRRLIQMFGSVVLGIHDEAFEEVLESFKESKGVSADTDLTAEDLKSLTEKFKAVVRVKRLIPPGSLEQMPWQRSGFLSWNGKRAKDSPAADIPDDLGPPSTSSPWSSENRRDFGYGCGLHTQPLHG